MPPFPYLQAPNWNALFAPRTTATSSPAGCLGKGQPRDNIDGGSNVVYADHDRGRKTVKETPSPAHTRIHVRRKATQWEERRFFGPPRHALYQPYLGRENPAKFFRQGKSFPSTPSAPQKTLYPNFSPFLHLVPQNDPTRDKDRPGLTRWSRRSLSWACGLPSCCCSLSRRFRVVLLRC